MVLIGKRVRRLLDLPLDGRVPANVLEQRFGTRDYRRASEIANAQAEAIMEANRRTAYERKKQAERDRLRKKRLEARNDQVVRRAYEFLGLEPEPIEAYVRPPTRKERPGVQEKARLYDRYRPVMRTRKDTLKTYDNMTSKVHLRSYEFDNYQYDFIEFLHLVKEGIRKWASRSENQRFQLLVYSDRSIHHMFSTKWGTIDEVYRDAGEWYRRLIYAYEADFRIDRIEFKYRERGDRNRGRGSARTMEQANKKWYETGKSTKTNCLYVAYTMAEMLMAGMDVEEVDKRSVDLARDLKRKIKRKMEKKEISIHETYADDEDIQILANYKKTVIHRYNNLYQRVKTFEPEKRLCSKTLKKYGGTPEISVRLANGHFTALVEWRHLSFDRQEVEPRLLEEGEEKSKMIIPRFTRKPLDTKIAVYDIETSVDEHQGMKSYAIGMAWREGEDQRYKDFWGLDCIPRFMNWLVENLDKFDGYTLYAHNGGKFDVALLLREDILKRHGLRSVHKECVELNGWVNITLKSDKHTIRFKDSYRMLPDGLAKLTRDMKVEHQKLAETVKHEDITLENWASFPQLKPYLRNDCLGLLEVLEYFSRQVYDTFQINITECYTSASLAKKAFWRLFYQMRVWEYSVGGVRKTKSEPMYPLYTLNKKVDRYIRSSYYGGRVECFYMGEISKKLYYMDFTSLFPDVGRNDLPYGFPEPMGADEIWTGHQLNKNFFGFVRCRVRTVRRDMKPLHGYRMNKKLTFPVFEKPTEMVLFSEELRLGLSLGMYEYEVLDGYGFKRHPFLKEFFEMGFSRKAQEKENGNPALALAWKIIINSGYGFFGLRTENRDGVVFLNKDEEDMLDVYEDSGMLKHFGVLGNYIFARLEKDLPIKDFNVGVASAITSYARMKLYQAIVDIESKGHTVYYCDTDSIITDCKLNDYPDLMKRYMPDGEGKALGSLKNEADEKMGGLLKAIQEKEGGMVHFDRLVLNGAKFYALEKDMPDGGKVSISKGKGYMSAKDSSLSYADQRDISGGSVKTQKQTQIRLSRNAMCSETDTFQIKRAYVDKCFRKYYDKGVLMETGVVEPLVVR